MSNNVITVKRTAVSANDNMVGKSVTLADGSRTKIDSVASSAAYSLSGVRGRVSAYLIVKEGRVFKLLDPSELDGTVVSVRDAGGYAVYKFVEKAAGRKQRSPKPQDDAAPATTGRRSKVNAKAEVEEQAAPARRTRRSKDDAEVKPTVQRRVKQEETFPVSPAVTAIAESGELSAKSVKLLRTEIETLIAAHLNNGIPEAVVTSEAKFGESRILLSFGIDLTNAFNAEAEEVDIDEATEWLLENKIITARELRRMSDEDIIAAYTKENGDEGQEESSEDEPNDEPNDFDGEPEDFDDEPEDDEGDEGEEDEDEPALIELPIIASHMKGRTPLRGDKRNALEEALTEALGVKAVAGTVMVLRSKDGDSEEYVQLVNYIEHSNVAAGVLLLARVEVVGAGEDELEVSHRMIVLSKAGFSRLSPLFDYVDADDESSEVDPDDGLDMDVDFEL